MGQVTQQKGRIAGHIQRLNRCLVVLQNLEVKMQKKRKTGAPTVEVVCAIIVVVPVIIQPVMATVGSICVSTSIGVGIV